MGVPNLLWAEGSAGPLAFPAGARGREWGWGRLLHLNEEAEAALTLGGRGWVGNCKRPKKKKPFRPHEKGSLQTPTLQRHFFSFFEGGGQLMSLFLPFVWLCRQPSVAAWPLSSPSLSSPFPVLLIRRETFPWKRAPRGGGEKELWQRRGRRRKEEKKQQTGPGSGDKKGP